MLWVRPQTATFLNVAAVSRKVAVPPSTKSSLVCASGRQPRSRCKWPHGRRCLSLSGLTMSTFATFPSMVGMAMLPRDREYKRCSSRHYLGHLVVFLTKYKPKRFVKFRSISIYCASFSSTLLFYRVFRRFWLNVGKSRKMIIFGSLLTTFEVSYMFLRQLWQYQKIARA